MKVGVDGLGVRGILLTGFTGVGIFWQLNFGIGFLISFVYLIFGACRKDAGTFIEREFMEVCRGWLLER